MSFFAVMPTGVGVDSLCQTGYDRTITDFMKSVIILKALPLVNDARTVAHNRET